MTIEFSNKQMLAKVSQWSDGYESLLRVISRENGEKKLKTELFCFFFFYDRNLVGCLYVYEDKPTEIEKKYDDVEEKNEEFQK